MQHTTHTEILTAPSTWASYLISGDDSGIDPEERVDCDAWLTAEGLGTPVSCEDAGFVHYHDAHSYVGPADCQAYVFIVSL